MINLNVRRIFLSILDIPDIPGAELFYPLVKFFINKLSRDCGIILDNPDTC